MTTPIQQVLDILGQHGGCLTPDGRGYTIGLPGLSRTRRTKVITVMPGEAPSWRNPLVPPGQVETGYIRDTAIGPVCVVTWQFSTPRRRARQDGPRREDLDRLTEATSGLLNDLEGVLPVLVHRVYAPAAGHRLVAAPSPVWSMCRQLGDPAVRERIEPGPFVRRWLEGCQTNLVDPWVVGGIYRVLEDFSLLRDVPLLLDWRHECPPAWQARMALDAAQGDPYAAALLEGDLAALSARELRGVVDYARGLQRGDGGND